MTDDVLGKNNHLKIGSVVSYRCTGISKKGIPIRPVINKIRNDVTWTDVLENYPTAQYRFSPGMKFSIM